MSKIKENWNKKSKLDKILIILELILFIPMLVFFILNLLNDVFRDFFWLLFSISQAILSFYNYINYKNNRKVAVLFLIMAIFLSIMFIIMILHMLI